jgi:hypothetical protein
MNSFEGVKLPTFTIPTFKCCSLILTFDDIEAVLGSAPRIVQIGIGEVEKSRHLFEDLNVNWLFSPNGWPLFASGFNPGIPEDQQAFKHDMVDKKMQFASGTARVSMSYPEILDLLRNTSSPHVCIVSLPCEEVPLVKDEEPKAEKSKRKIARRNQSFTDSISAISTDSEFKFVMPLTGVANQLEALESMPNRSAVVGMSGPKERMESRGDLMRCMQLRSTGDLSVALSEIKKGLIEKTAEIYETDLPFAAAKNGLLLNEKYEFEDLKISETFHNLDFLLPKVHEDTPVSVVQAAAHTKAYIHHLFRCDELSGPILLATVNLYQLEKLFRSYRS